MLIASSNAALMDSQMTEFVVPHSESKFQVNDNFNNLTNSHGILMLEMDNNVINADEEHNGLDELIFMDEAE